MSYASPSFVPPTKLAQLKANTPVHVFSSSPPSTSNGQSSGRTPMLSAGSDIPPQRPNQPQSHSRTSSFFNSFRRSTVDTQNGLVPNPLSPQKANSNGNTGLSASSQPSQPSHNARPSTSESMQQQQQRQTSPQRATLNRSTSQTDNDNNLALTKTTSGQPSQQQQQPQLHPEIRSVVGLTVAHARKIYFSGPLVRRIERQPDGQRPTNDEGWVEVWAQLGGTTLSIWDMKQVHEASAQGREVPPTYVNMTDAFVQVLGSVTVPATPNVPQQRYANVLTLNTAGSNLLLFSCSSTGALISWASALRLSAWEKSRLEEIYTAHLIRITLKSPDIPTTLVRGRMEGWVQVRVAGQTDWKKVWMVINASMDGTSEPPGSAGSQFGKKKRISHLFNRDHSPVRNGPSLAFLSMYVSHKPKDKKRPLLSMSAMTQAFAVYPERPELISKSTLIKVEGLLGDEDTAAGMRSREGWLLIMPDLEGSLTPSAEMLKWIVALHDAFCLYGRPEKWTWDPRDIASLMFGYPVGPAKDDLFLDREMAEQMDPRDDRTSIIRKKLLNILEQKMEKEFPNRIPPRGSNDTAPTPIDRDGINGGRRAGPQLPPLSFDGASKQQPASGELSPITEQSSILTRGLSLSGDAPSVVNNRMSTQVPVSHPPNNSTSPVPEEPRPSSAASGSFLHNGLSSSPTPASPPLPAKDNPISRRSQDSTLSSPRQSLAARGTSFSSIPTSDLAANIALPVSPDSKNESMQSPKSQSSSPLVPPNATIRSHSPPSSILTSPHSIPGDAQSISHSVLTSPYSLDGPKGGQANSFLTLGASTTPTSITHAQDSDLSKEAGALYYMQFDHEPASPQAPAAASNIRRLPTTIAENDEDDSSSQNSGADRKLSSPYVNTPSTIKGPRANPASRQNSNDVPSDIATGRQSPPETRLGLGRKPSGARAPSSYAATSDRRFSPQHITEAEDTSSERSVQDKMEGPTQKAPSESEDHDLDALAALSYLDVEEAPAVPKIEPLRPRHNDTPPLDPLPADSNGQFKSSFALSKLAERRKATAEANQAAHQAAVHRPGRANGRKKKMTDSSPWNDSSEEEEEEEEEEEDEDVDSDVEPTLPQSKPASGLASSSSSFGPPQHQNISSGNVNEMPSQSHLRPPRNLPQIPQMPQNRPQERDEYNMPRRTIVEEGPQIRSQSEYPQSGAARQSMWSQVLEPGHAPENRAGNEPFVQIEPPSKTMTKAFTPQGLLSAGMQDKQDRSAKRQEELARESGASLINVPNKPPPPQTGLLGAITAHERERKREGGVGAALTEREREKRQAEERQRRFDEQQRQQMDQMQQGGSMYGYNPMMNPMMMGMMGMNPMMAGGMNPMMTGMNPMMTGGMNPMMAGGYPGMMQGYNPQHLFAAQQAQQAYQQAMMAFSAAGSQAGGDTSGVAPNAGQPNPMMSPMMTGPMSMYDPRMSMMGMPMQMAPMGMQMTGMSNFDPRFPPSNNLTPSQDALTGPGNNPTPPSRGSPLARSIDRPLTPKN